MVYVTHDQVEAMSMADRVILLSAGRIEQNGTPAELYEAPANTFVARFIGTPPMNLLRLEHGAGGAVIAGTKGPVIASESLSESTVGVRPEDVVLTPGAGFEGEVSGVEYLGADSLLNCRIGTQTLVARVAGRLALARGDAVTLTWPPARCISSTVPTAIASRLNPSPIGDRIRLTSTTQDLKEEGHHVAYLQSRLALPVASRSRRFPCSPRRSRTSRFRSTTRSPSVHHQDHRRPRRGFREGESRHQGQTDLFGRLSHRSRRR
jgi:hypothetical protein